MPPDPTPLTEAELNRLAADAPIARSILSKLCSQLRPPAMSIPVREDDEDEVLRRCLDALPALLAAARENAERERTVGMCQKCGTRVAVKHGRVEDGGLLFHDVCHWMRQREELTAENAGLRDELAYTRQRVASLESTIRALTTAVATITAERAAAICERDERIRANVRLCEEIKNHRAERDMAQLELSRANVRYEQSHRRAEAMWRERDAAIIERDAALNLAEARENNGPHSRTALMESLNRAMNAQASLIRERDAALARVAELKKKLPLSLDDPRATSGALLERLESYPNPCPPNCDEEGHECVPPPDLMWVRCPSACSDGMIHAGSGVWRGCFTCGSSGRPGWVKETPQ